MHNLFSKKQEGDPRLLTVREFVIITRKVHQITKGSKMCIRLEGHSKRSSYERSEHISAVYCLNPTSSNFHRFYQHSLGKDVKKSFSEG